MGLCFSLRSRGAPGDLLDSFTLVALVVSFTLLEPGSRRGPGLAAVASGISRRCRAFRPSSRPCPPRTSLLGVHDGGTSSRCFAAEFSFRDPRADRRGRSAPRGFPEHLWMVLGAAVVLANGYAIWVMSAGPSDRRRQRFWFRPADEGPWIEISGQARGARAEFLYDTATGRFERTRTVIGAVRSCRAMESEPPGSREATAALRLDPLRTSERSTIRAAEPVATRLLIEGYPLPSRAVGRRLSPCDLGNGVLTIHDVVPRAHPRLGKGSGRRSAKTPRRVRRSGCLPRSTASGTEAIEILQMDAGDAERHRAVSERSRASPADSFGIDAPGITALHRERPRDPSLFDGATGAPLATLGRGGGSARWPGILPDGRIVMTGTRSA